MTEEQTDCCKKVCKLPAGDVKLVVVASLFVCSVDAFFERASGGVVSTLDSNAGEPGSSPGGGKDIFSRMRRPITW